MILQLADNFATGDWVIPTTLKVSATLLLADKLFPQLQKDAFSTENQRMALQLTPYDL